MTHNSFSSTFFPPLLIPFESKNIGPKCNQQGVSKSLVLGLLLAKFNEPCVISLNGLCRTPYVNKHVVSYKLPSSEHDALIMGLGSCLGKWASRILAQSVIVTNLPPSPLLASSDQSHHEDCIAGHRHALSLLDKRSHVNYSICPNDTHALWREASFHIMFNFF